MALTAQGGRHPSRSTYSQAPPQPPLQTALDGSALGRGGKQAKTSRWSPTLVRLGGQEAFVDDPLVLNRGSCSERRAASRSPESEHFFRDEPS